MIRSHELEHSGKYFHLVEMDPQDVTEIHKPEYSSPTNADRHEAYISRLPERLAKEPIWFGGIKSFDDLEALLHNGWPEGTRKALELREKLSVDVPWSQAPRRRLRWGDEGDEIEMQRVWSGALDIAWRQKRRTIAHEPRVVSINLAIGGNANVKAEQLFWCGAAAIVLSDILEDQNFRVEINAVTSAEHGGEPWYHACRVALKNADDPLNPDSIASWTAHAGLFRAYLIPAAASGAKGVSSGWGWNTNITKLLRSAEQAHIIEPADIIIEHAYDKQSAITNIKSALEKITALNNQEGAAA